MRAGRVWSIGGGEGYAVCDDGGTLLEFFHGAREADLRLAALDAVIEATGAGEVLVQSFDRHLMALLERRGVRLTEAGLLFRTTRPAFALAGPALHAEPAAEGDVAAVLALEPDFFDGAAEALSYIRDGDAELVLFRDGGGVLVGCGLARTVVPGRPGVDIGMVVARGRRGAGAGRAIVAAMRARVAARGGRAICGCDIANAASARCLEHAGFVADHRLLHGLLEGT